MKGEMGVYLVEISRMTLPGCALLRLLMLRLPGPCPLTALLMIAFLSCLLSMPIVLCAALVKAALVSGAPAPFACLLREKTVTCFLAAVAITITANLPLPGINSWTGLILCHDAGIFCSFLAVGFMLFWA
jgi:hypothetical protein